MQSHGKVNILKYLVAFGTLAVTQLNRWSHRYIRLMSCSHKKLQLDTQTMKYTKKLIK